MWALGLRRSLARSTSVSSPNNLAYRHVAFLGRTTTTLNTRAFSVSMSRSFMKTAMNMEEAAETSDTAQDTEPKKATKRPLTEEGKLKATIEKQIAKVKAKKEEEMVKIKAGLEEANARTSAKIEEIKAKKAALLEKLKAKKKEKAEQQEKIRARKKEQAMQVKAKRRERAAKANERAKLRREKLAAKAEQLRVDKKGLRCPVSPPLRPYQHFMKSAYESYKADHPTADSAAAKAAFREHAQKWKELSPEEKAAYVDPDFDAKKKEYLEKREEWKKSLNRNQVVALSKKRKYGHVTIYAQFLREHFPKEIPEGQTFEDVSRRLIAEFRALSEEEKEPYKIRAAEASAKIKEDRANAAESATAK